MDNPKLQGKMAVDRMAKAPSAAVIFHGAASDADGIFALTAKLRLNPRQRATLVPSAPYLLDDRGPMSPFAGGDLEQDLDVLTFSGPKRAFSWLPMKETISDEEIAATADTIDRYLDGWLRPENVGNPEDVLFVGFCQGASLALHVALRQSRPCAGLVLFSGPVLVPELEVKARPPVCVIHGDADPFFPPETLTETVDFLRKAGLEPESHLLPGLGHCIDSRGVAIARDFIARRLAAPRS